MRILLLLVPALFFTIFTTLLIPQKSPIPYNPNLVPFKSTDFLFGMYTWKKPLSPPRVGLQVGHWKHDEAPVELSRLWDNSGTQAAGKTELEVNFSIAVETAKILRKEGFVVDILPTTIPPWYQADVFVSIHADGHTDKKVSGFKVSPPWRDFTGRSRDLAKIIEEEYAKSTNLPIDTNITENMTHYYAFSWKRFKHAIHPMTPAVIVETGFLTSRKDRQVIVFEQERSVNGLANAIIKFMGKSL